MTRDARRASIIAATLPLLRDKGPGVSTKEIAQAAGIAEGTIFRVFESKDEIVHACIHESCDNSALVTELDAIDRALPLAVRLAAAVAVMQGQLRGMVALMTMLQSSGEPPPGRRPAGPDAMRRRQDSTTELDAAFVALIGDDAARLRVPASTFVGYLRMLTLSSVHPMLGGDGSPPEQLVDVLLEGALARSETPTPHVPNASNNASTTPASTRRNK